MERRHLVSLWKHDAAGVLVTLVRVEGSSYRRPGAHLLTRSAGAGHAGTISGGCLESEVIRRAQWIAREQAAVERYATTFDDTSDIPFGLGCGGTVDLLFEAANRPEGEALMRAMAESLSRKRPPSLNESGVMLTTPITRVRRPSSRVRVRSFQGLVGRIAIGTSMVDDQEPAGAKQAAEKG